MIVYYVSRRLNHSLIALLITIKETMKGNFEQIVDNLYNCLYGGLLSESVIDLLSVNHKHHHLKHRHRGPQYLRHGPKFRWFANISPPFT